jgi:hypothetical protein
MKYSQTLDIIKPLQGCERDGVDFAFSTIIQLLRSCSCPRRGQIIVELHDTKYPQPRSACLAADRVELLN